MAAIQNEIDQLFLATLEQSEPGGGDGTRAIMLNSSSPAGFKRSATGVLTPTEIVFDAVPLNMAGAIVTWTTDGVSLAKTGNTATLAASAMGVATGAVVKCTLDFESVRYERTFVVQVVADGMNGESTELTSAQIKAALEGQITETELFGELRTRIGLIDAGAGVTGSVAARVKTEADARVAGLTQEASDRTTYVQGYTYSKAQTDESLSIQANTITAAYTAYADEARRLAGVTSSADIRNYAYSKASADEALTALATTLRSEFSSNNGATVAYVEGYTYSKANTDNAIASMATTLRAEFSNSAGVTAAWVQNYAYSKAEANSAIASQTQDLRTTVGNNSAAISTQAESVNGLRAQYTVKIDNNGYVTGYGLASSYVNGIPTSAFIINADRFAVVSPGVAPRTMFAVGKVNGQTAVGMSGDVYLDGSINVRAADGTLLLGAGGEFGAKVRARNLVVGTPDNIVPDPEFRDLAWWDRVGRASVSFWADQGISTFWQSGSSMYLSANAGESLSTSRSFPVTPGATYIIKCQVSLSNDFNGYFSLFATIPGYVDHNMTGERVVENWNDGMPVHLNYSSQKGGRTFVTKLTLPESGTLSKAVIQIRNRHTVGSIEIGGLSITRVADGSLVGDGAVEARHVKTKSLTADLINVDRVSAISGTIGRFATADSGARIEIRDNIIEGFNTNNTRRFRISA